MPADRTENTQPRFPAWRARNAHLRLWIILVLVLAGDLASKHYVFRWLGEPPVAGEWATQPADPASRPEAPRVHVVVPSFLEFRTSYNEGAALGMLQGYGLVFVAAGAGALGLFLWLFARSGPKQWFYQAGISMVLGGALGNIYDRVVVGRVRDFIQISTRWSDLNASWSQRGIYPYIWNVADAALVVGVSVILLVWFRQAWLDHQAEKAAKSKPAKR